MEVTVNRNKSYVANNMKYVERIVKLKSQYDQYDKLIHDIASIPPNTLSFCDDKHEYKLPYNPEFSKELKEVIINKIKEECTRIFDDLDEELDDLKDAKWR